MKRLNDIRVMTEEIVTKTLVKCGPDVSTEPSSQFIHLVHDMAQPLAILVDIIEKNLFVDSPEKRAAMKCIDDLMDIPADLVVRIRRVSQ
jgi:hypothetical protein